MRILIGLAITAVLVANSAVAFAQATDDQSGTVRADFAALDKNRDGFLTRAEASADREISKRFAQFDADHDGRLSESEYMMAKDDNNRRMLRDALVTARVKAALLAEKGIPSFSISVDTYEGQVQLAGFVGSPELVSKAGRVTATVNGVRIVNNNISVKALQGGG